MTDNLNRKMAELMGWELRIPVYHDCCPTNISPKWFDAAGEVQASCYFNPTHDIADAFKVVEKLGSTCNLDITRDINKDWFVAITPWDSGIIDWTKNKSLPLAICLAAEKVMEDK